MSDYRNGGGFTNNAADFAAGLTFLHELCTNEKYGIRTLRGGNLLMISKNGFSRYVVEPSSVVRSHVIKDLRCVSSTSGVDCKASSQSFIDDFYVDIVFELRSLGLIGHRSFLLCQHPAFSRSCCSNVLHACISGACRCLTSFSRPRKLSELRDSRKSIQVFNGSRI